MRNLAGIRASVEWPERFGYDDNMTQTSNNHVRSYKLHAIANKRTRHCWYANKAGASSGGRKRCAATNWWGTWTYARGTKTWAKPSSTLKPVRKVSGQRGCRSVATLTLGWQRGNTVGAVSLHVPRVADQTRM